jgi:hypothetical protein
MFRKSPVKTALTAVLLIACRSQPIKPVEDLAGTHNAADLALTSLKGTRDGDRVAVQAVYGNGSRSLTVQLRFRLTPQAQLDHGTWAGLAGEGSVQQRSVIFLGGQSSPPSIGGRFDLIGSGDRAMYRVTIPLQPLKDPL